MRKSEARDYLCPTCRQPTLICAGKTTPDKATGKQYQRYRCLNPDCPKIITTRPLQAETKNVEVPQDGEVLVIRRDNKGRFTKQQS